MTDHFITSQVVMVGGLRDSRRRLSEGEELLEGQSEIV